MFMQFICTPDLLFFSSSSWHGTFFSLYWACYNITSVLPFGFFGHEAYGILDIWPRIESTLPALEGEVLKIGLLGKYHRPAFDIHRALLTSTPSWSVRPFSLESCNFPMLLQDSNKMDNTLTVYDCLSPNTESLDTPSSSKFNHIKCPLCESKAVKSQQVYAVLANRFGL